VSSLYLFIMFVLLVFGAFNFVRLFRPFIFEYLLGFSFRWISNANILLQSLRTRFIQSQENVAYTILALLPTLSSQVLKEMHIDALTRDLQVRSRSSLFSSVKTSVKPSFKYRHYFTPNTQPTNRRLPSDFCPSNPSRRCRYTF